MAVVAAATPAVSIANGSSIAPKTVAACQSTTDLAALTDALIQIGWTPRVPAQLDDRAIRSYAATFLVNHLGHGDFSDARIASTWNLALKNAAGARNLKIVEGSPQKDRWFVLEQTGSVLRTDSFTHKTHGQIECVITLNRENSPYTFQKLLGSSDQDPRTFPPVHHLRSRQSESGKLKRSLGVAILNTERISAASGSEFDVSSIYTTFVSQQPEKSQ